MVTKEKKSYSLLWIIIFALVLICLFSNIINSLSIKAPGIFNSDYGYQLDASFDIYENGDYLLNTKLPYTF